MSVEAPEVTAARHRAVVGYVLARWRPDLAADPAAWDYAESSLYAAARTYSPSLAGGKPFRYFAALSVRLALRGYSRTKARHAELDRRKACPAGHRDRPADDRIDVREAVARLARPADRAFVALWLECCGDERATARRLGVSRSAVWQRLKRVSRELRRSLSAYRTGEV